MPVKEYRTETHVPITRQRWKIPFFYDILRELISLLMYYKHNVIPVTFTGIRTLYVKIYINYFQHTLQYIQLVCYEYE